MAPLLFISAGEVSGDLHGAHLARALLERLPDLRLRGLGSYRMKEAGVEVLDDITRYSAVGLLEHLPGVRPVSAALQAARESLAAERPSAVVLIDYQGMNMQLARTAKAMGIPTLYYISPQEWIWGFKGGARKVAEVTDLILAVFEREAEVYRAAGAQVEFIGHPLLDMVPPSSERGALAQRLGLDSTAAIVSLFPGSRRMEVRRLLPAMLEAASLMRGELPEIQFLLPVATPDLMDLISPLLLAHDDLKVILCQDVPGMALMQLSDVVLAASGTVILESAVVGTPVVAAYRVGRLAAFVARRLMRRPFVTLPNIVADEFIVPELLQRDATGSRMAETVLGLLQNPRERFEMIQRLGQVRAKLGTPGAIARAADRILANLTPKGNRGARASGRG